MHNLDTKLPNMDITNKLFWEVKVPQRWDLITFKWKDYNILHIDFVGMVAKPIDWGFSELISNKEYILETLKNIEEDRLEIEILRAVWK
jgi:hypothetical protein